ncbi:MAG: CopG family transcriptional regulator [Euryarchaeota archaeon]|nr:CopG family transcriptional regulator [Euryarchaeota archaeon]
MTQRYSLVCDDRLAAKVDAIAQEYELTETEVLRQLVTIGLEQREMAAR